MAQEQLLRQNAESFALNQKFRSDFHHVFMSAVGWPLEKQPDSSVPALIDPPASEARIEEEEGKPARPTSQFPNRSSARDQLLRQNAERFALDQKISSDIHDVFMSGVGRRLEKQPDSGVPASIDLPTMEVRIAGKKGKLAPAICQYPERASWLAAGMLERGWGKSDPSNFGGPDRKTIEKILRGEVVRNDVLEKLATALSNRHVKVSVTEIPQD